MSLKVLIFGYPRSGTKYIATVLQKLGLDVGHEKIEADGGVGYMFADPKRRLPFSEVDVVGMVVRDPRWAIASAEANLSAEMENVKKVGGFAEWWVYWNKLCLKALGEAAQCFSKTTMFRIENAEREMAVLAELFGLSMNDDAWAVDKNLNHRKPYEPKDWDELPESVRKMAHIFGYREVNKHAVS